MLGIIAVITVVILFGMPFWLFGKGKNSAHVPDPVPAEEFQPVNDKEMTIVRKMLMDLISIGLVDKFSRINLENTISAWKSGQSYVHFMQKFVDELKNISSTNWSMLKRLVIEEKEALETISHMRGLDSLMANNTRVCRICNDCLVQIIEKDKI